MTQTERELKIAEAVRDAVLEAYFGNAFTVTPIDLPAIIAAIPAASEPVAVPEGWKLVPVDPTPDQISAMYSVSVRRQPTNWEPVMYRAMLAAAPQPEQPAQALTDDELDQMRQASGLNFVTLREFRLIARAIEARLRQ